jgi:uncharacterized protein YjbI with pentapeptide repeats
MSKITLTDRWRFEGILGRAFEKVTEIFQNGSKIQSEFIPAEFINGKIDIRGIKNEESKIKNCECTNIDFSFSSFKNCWIENSLFEKCLFKKVDFSDFSDHKNNFNECTFIECNFNSSGIGYDGSEFLECIFDNCKFTKTIFNRPEFIGVIFKNCRIKNIDFNASSFEDCSFEGELDDVWFRGGFPTKSQVEYFGEPKVNKMKNVSFENAELRDLTFSNNCDLSLVKINPSDKYYKFDNWKKRLEVLKSESSIWGDKEKKKLRFLQILI